MYLGTQIKMVPVWSQRWIDGPFRGGRMESYRAGMATRETHLYRCDHCGRETAGQIFKADEPFYCHCQRLISIKPL